MLKREKYFLFNYYDFDLELEMRSSHNNLAKCLYRGSANDFLKKNRDFLG